MVTRAEPTASLRLYWNKRRKQWDVVIGGNDGARHWTWNLAADTSVALDEGTGWLICKAVVDALESQLV